MRHYTQKGFTMIELLLCLGIIGLLASLVAGPTVASQLADQQLTSTAITLTNNLRLARHSAVHETKVYQVRIRQTGYYVMREAHPIWDTVDYIAWPAGISLASGYGDQNINITFSETGVYDAWQNNTVHLQNGQGSVRKIIISPGGRIRIE